MSYSGRVTSTIKLMFTSSMGTFIILAIMKMTYFKFSISNKTG